tara:strand:+ start:66 stop:677 length:612 start_codon:yes stop_codon:yes gene_type:complete
MTDYETMISQFGKHWGQDQAGLENIMDTIAHHESKGQNVYQTGGGPGAGFFQYETGAGQGGMTARNRLANWYKSQGANIPEWLIQEGMDEKGFDASKLNKEQQRMMFLADKRYDKTASLTKEATEDIANWWAKEHWRGGEEGSDIYKTRVASFNRDLRDSNRNESQNPVESTMNDYAQADSAFTQKPKTPSYDADFWNKDWIV